jgi:fermentation-respiration switch protein FrsA (DUF1100 family)
LSSVLLNALLYFPSRALHTTPAAIGLAHRDLAFDTEDGERLHGWWVPAPGGPARGHLLHFHGNAGNIADRVPELTLLAALGLDVLLFDYRGYGRSSGRPSEAGTYRDARAARAALLAQDGVRPERIFYVGESLGGAVAVSLALEAPPGGLVLRSTFTSVRAMGRRHYPLVPSVAVPDAYPTLERIAGLRCPLLVVHGMADEIVPLSHAQALVAAAPEPKRLVAVPGVGHNDWALVARCAEALGEDLRAGRF